MTSATNAANTRDGSNTQYPLELLKTHHVNGS
jgi:hypothetical protein